MIGKTGIKRNLALRFLQIHTYGVRYRILAETISTWFYHRKIWLQRNHCRLKNFQHRAWINQYFTIWMGRHQSSFKRILHWNGSPGFFHPWTQRLSWYQTAQMADNKRWLWAHLHYQLKPQFLIMYRTVILIFVLNIFKWFSNWTLVLPHFF